MRPEDYKNINELRAFILNKINTSENLEVKYKKFKSKKNLMMILSLGTLGFSISYYIYQSIILGIPSIMPSIYFLCTVGIGLLTMIGLDTIQNSFFEHKIEYTHQDFEILANILSRSELSLFMKEIEKENSLIMWQEFVTPKIETDIICSSTENVENREANREKYIDSLYNRTSS